MVRRELREHVFKMLFQIEFIDVKDMPEHLELYFDNLPNASDKDKEYITDKVNNIIEKIPEIDNIINEKTTGWKTTRMSKVDLTLLRLALYEMIYDEDVPTSVAINEAVELAKGFSGENAPKFINGVLAKCITSIQ